MSMNLTKNKLLWIKGSAQISLPNYTLEVTQSIKDLGLFVTDSLNWTLHAKKRTEKALNAFFLMKQNLCKANFATRKNAYVCYLVPIVSYGAALWKPSNGDLALLESVQRKTMSWIFKTSNSALSFKEKLQKINILPLSIYQELHVVLLFAKMLSGKVDIDWQSHVTLSEVGTRRAQVTRNFICKQMRLQKSESVFGTEPVTLQICSMIISNMISSLIESTKEDFWNSTIGSSYPATTKQTLALGVSCVAAIIVET